MNTTIFERRRRRRHSAEFKAVAVAACRQPGVLSAAGALSRSVNAKLLRRLVVEADQAAETPLGSPQPKALLPPSIDAQRFIPVAVEGLSKSDAQIRLEIRRGATTVSAE